MPARLAALAAALLLAPAAALADPAALAVADPPRETWVEVHFGASFPQEPTVSGGGHFDPRGPAAGVAAGLRLSRWVGVELSLGVEAASDDTPWGRWEEQDVTLAPALRLRAPLGIVELSAYGGPAAHYASWKFRQSRPLPGSVALARSSDHGGGFGGVAGVGVGFHVSRTVLVGADARRTFGEVHFRSGWERMDRLRTVLTVTWQP